MGAVRHVDSDPNRHRASRAALVPLGRIPLTTAAKKTKAGERKIGPIMALLPIVILVSTRSYTAGTLNTYLPEWYASQGASLTLAGSAFRWC